MLGYFDSLRTLLTLFEPTCPANEQVKFLRQLSREQLDALALESQKQDVAALFYSMLVELELANELDFSLKENLKQHYLFTATRNTLFLHEAEQLLSSLKAAGIPAAGLKGIYLLENLYSNIAARPMNDIDVLVRKKDLGDCLSITEKLGYVSSSYFRLSDKNIDTKHVPPIRKKSGAMVELHWTLLEEDEPFTIDFDALWGRMLPANIAKVETLTLGVEDLILHLCLHLTYQHYFNLGLRGLMDIALFIHKINQQIDWTRLTETAHAWGSERVTALTLSLVDTLLNIPIPAKVFTDLLPEGLEPSLLEQACFQLLDREKSEARLTPDLVKMNADQKLISKIRIGLQRIFIPRLALARIYGVNPKSPRIVWFYWVRLKYLVKVYGGTMRKLQSLKTSSQPALRKAENSYALHDWMSRKGG